MSSLQYTRVIMYAGEVGHTLYKHMCSNIIKKLSDNITMTIIISGFLSKHAQKLV